MKGEIQEWMVVGEGAFVKNLNSFPCITWVATHGNNTGTVCKVLKKILFCLALYTVVMATTLMPVQSVCIGMHIWWHHKEVGQPVH
jgi:hypothetical protein